MNVVYAIIAAGLAWLFLQQRKPEQGQGDQAADLGGWMPAFDMALPDQDLAAVGGWIPSFEDDAFMGTPDPTRDTVPDQLATPVETLIVYAQQAAQSIPATLGFARPRINQPIQERNVRAFLDMIAYAEGTGGPNGYRTLFGGGLFEDTADHPRQYFNFRDGAGRNLRTSAAGRYQFLARTWDALSKKLQLPDFGPQSQDLAALELIRERGALGDVQAGRVGAAVKKCAPVWASLPGAGYAQPERKLTALLDSYQAAGGNLEA